MINNTKNISYGSFQHAAGYEIKELWDFFKFFGLIVETSQIYFLNVMQISGF